MGMEEAPDAAPLIEEPGARRVRSFEPASRVQRPGHWHVGCVFFVQADGDESKRDEDVEEPTPHGVLVVQGERTKVDHRAPGPWTLLRAAKFATVNSPRNSSRASAVHALHSGCLDPDHGGSRQEEELAAVHHRG
jgi:hypothetical protein